jgi:putative NIF3 family GTP cyclohydrolase 1 type 2
MGAIGEIDKPMDRDEFLFHVVKCLKIKNFRHTKGSGKKIKTVAVCGGSGSELIPDVIKAGADSYVTADIKYHTFFDNEERLLLIDAGHYETEILVLKELYKRLSDLTNGKKIKVYKYSKSTNPVIFYNNSGAKLN